MNPFRIFIAYSRRDAEFLEQLRPHLAPLEINRRCEVWYDAKLHPGEVWEDELVRQIQQADVIVLLVSADSIDSDYFYEKELPLAIERQRSGQARLVPFILRPCQWKATALRQLQALPKDGRPVTQFAVRDDAYDELAAFLLGLLPDSENSTANSSAVLTYSQNTTTGVEPAKPDFWEKNRAVISLAATALLFLLAWAIYAIFKPDEKQIAYNEKTAEPAIKKEDTTQQKQPQPGPENKPTGAKPAQPQPSTNPSKEKKEPDPPAKSVAESPLLNTSIVKVANLKMSQYEVTNEQFAVFLGHNWNSPNLEKWIQLDKTGIGIEQKSNGKFAPKSGFESLPVCWVTWDGANAFVKWLSENIKNGKNYRLPTKKEWNSAAAASSGGSQIFMKTSPSGVYELAQSSSGIAGFAGNLAEWCSDSVDENGQPGTGYVWAAGGSFRNSTASSLGAEQGQSLQKGRGYGYVGFRILEK